MKLSEAIRLGAMIRPQARGAFFKGGGSCALGAALEAVGVEYYEYGGISPDDYRQIHTRWPWTGVRYKGAYVGLPKKPTDVIWRLNDSLLRTREEIADWVATQEPQEAEVVQLPSEQSELAKV